MLVRDQQCQILGHLATLHRLDADLLHRFGEIGHVRRVVELCAVAETACPGKDRGDRVGRGRLALLVLAIMARHRAVCGLGLDGLAVRGHQNRCHQAERSKALGHGIGLHIAVIVLAGPDKPAIPFQGAGDHVVDQAMLIGDAGVTELVGELAFIDFLEQVLEAPVIGFQDGVLG